jgi:hypothetical protein
MYGTEVVIPAVKAALKKRGFKYPKRGGGISKDAVMARRMAYAAFIEYCNVSRSGVATLIGCSPSTVWEFDNIPFSGFQSESALEDWLAQVGDEISKAQK